MGCPLWTNLAYSTGMPWEWTVNEAVPAHFFKPALEADEENERRQQSLLHPSCSHVETTILYASVALPVPLDGTIITSSTMLLIPTSRGTVTLSSASVNDPPIINPNYYHASRPYRFDIRNPACYASITGVIRWKVIRGQRDSSSRDRAAELPVHRRRN